MRKQHAGAIVNVSSIAAWSMLGGSDAPYAAAKAGLLALTRAVAAESGPDGIRCNAVAPGIVLTKWVEKNMPGVTRQADHTPLRRLGKPEDIAATIAFLAGAFLGGRLGARLGRHRARLLTVSICVEVVLVAAALLVSIFVRDPTATVGRYLLIVMLASAMGLQNAAARRLGVPDLTTTVLTLTLTGLAADASLASGVRSSLRVRLAATLMMFLGAGVGAIRAGPVDLIGCAGCGDGSTCGCGRAACGGGTTGAGATVVALRVTVGSAAGTWASANVGNRAISSRGRVGFMARSGVDRIYLAPAPVCRP